MPCVVDYDCTFNGTYAESDVKCEGKVCKIKKCSPYDVGEGCTVVKSSYQECVLNSECPQGQNCVGGVCQGVLEPGEECIVDDDCVTHNCVMNPSGSGVCEYVSDVCSYPLTTLQVQPCSTRESSRDIYCVNGRCGSSLGKFGDICLNDNDCAYGLFCEDSGFTSAQGVVVKVCKGKS